MLEMFSLFVFWRSLIYKGFFFPYIADFYFFLFLIAMLIWEFVFVGFWCLNLKGLFLSQKNQNKKSKSDELLGD